MGNLDFPMGLSPLNRDARVREYDITASFATEININDPVVRVAAGTVELITAGDTNPILGSAQGFKDADGQPQNKYPTGQTSAWKILVTDDPDQEYLAQEDNATSDLALADRGLNVAMVNTAAGVNGISGWELNSNTGATTATEQIRLIDLYRDAQNELGDYCKWVVKINNHQALQGVVGVGI